MTSNSWSLRFLFRKIFASIAMMFLVATPSLSEGVSIKNLGHSSLLIKGDDKSILLNPFKAVGCAEGLRESKLQVDIILASSELADEGSRISEGIFFVQPGSYLVNGFTFEGFSLPHDRLGGRRYGTSTLWTWNLGGFSFAHLGGAAAPLSFENKLLLGNPDVLIIAVGGGAKVYNGQEAANVVKALKPKIVIPVQYVRGKKPSECDQTGIQPFLDAMNGIEVKKVGNTLKLSKINSQKMTINLMK